MPDEWDGPPDDGMFGNRPRRNGKAAVARPDEFDRQRAEAAAAEVDRVAFLAQRAIAREQRYATVMAEQFRLACQHDPKGMGEAFAEVFDLSQWEEIGRSLLAEFSYARRRADESRSELDGISHYVKLLEKQVDRLTVALTEAGEQVKQLRAEVAAARPRKQTGGQHTAPGPE